MKFLVLTAITGILALNGPARAEPAAQGVTTYAESFAASKQDPWIVVQTTLASLTSAQPKAIAGVIEAVAQVWPDRLRDILGKASQTYPRWAPLMTAAAVGQKPGDVAGLRTAALQGLARSSAAQHGSSGPNAIGKQVVGKEIVGKEIVGKEPVTGEIDELLHLGAGPLTLAQYARLARAVELAALIASRNGPVNNWLWDGTINIGVVKKVVRLVLDPLVDGPIKVTGEPVTVDATPTGSSNQ